MSIKFERVPTYVRREIEPPKRMVATGARGRGVRRLQEWLSLHGHRTRIDGDFGPATLQCVRDFQSAVGIGGRGRIGASTWDALLAPVVGALAAPAGIKSMDFAAAAHAVAAQHVNQHPEEVGGPNAGPWVRLYCEGNDGPAWAWCAGFVSAVLAQAAFYTGEPMPLKGSVSCDTLAAQAKAAGRFVRGRDVASGRVPWPEGECCIFLLRRSSTDWTHTGFAMRVGKTPVFQTLEGNTNDEGSREGFEACRRTRNYANRSYDFIRL